MVIRKCLGNWSQESVKDNGWNSQWQWGGELEAIVLVWSVGKQCPWVGGKGVKELLGALVKSSTWYRDFNG